MADIKGFTLFHDYADVFAALCAQDCKELVLALFEYSENGSTPPLPAQAEIAFMFIRRSIDIGKQRQMAKSQRNRDIAKAGWDKRKHANACDGIKTMPEQEPEQEPEQLLSPLPPCEGSPAVDKPRQRRFVAPTISEVAAYCAQRGNGIGPQAFVDHYTANGWMRGKTPMKDWKACVRTWESNRREERRPSIEQSHVPRFNEITVTSTEDWDKL